jgi:hypothetical protein
MFERAVFDDVMFDRATLGGTVFAPQRRRDGTRLSVACADDPRPRQLTRLFGTQLHDGGTRQLGFVLALQFFGEHVFAHCGERLASMFAPGGKFRRAPTRPLGRLFATARLVRAQVLDAALLCRLSLCEQLGCALRAEAPCVLDHLCARPCLGLVALVRRAHTLIPCFGGGALSFLAETLTFCEEAIAAFDETTVMLDAKVGTWLRWRETRDRGGHHLRVGDEGLAATQPP